MVRFLSMQNRIVNQVGPYLVQFAHIYGNFGHAGPEFFDHLNILFPQFKTEQNKRVINILMNIGRLEVVGSVHVNMAFIDPTSREMRVEASAISLIILRRPIQVSSHGTTQVKFFRQSFFATRQAHRQKSHTLQVFRPLLFDGCHYPAASRSWYPLLQFAAMQNVLPYCLYCSLSVRPIRECAEFLRGGIALRHFFCQVIIAVKSLINSSEMPLIADAGLFNSCAARCKVTPAHSLSHAANCVVANARARWVI